METHISWLFLVGDRAYKLKKPVNFGFVDFTTPEKRKFYCEEELRLNRRLAPELYLGIRTITGNPAAPGLDGEGDPIDYVVEMLRFDQAELLANADRKGVLTCDHMDQLGDVIAAFHARCPRAAPDTPFGTAETSVRPVEENFRHLLSGNSPAAQVELLRRLLDWTHEEQPKLYPLFNTRKASGFVRECHGDLHLGNMLLRNNRVRIFDCIEFNEGLRWIDVLSDIAFCVMDLARRGRENLSHHLLNSYLEKTGDYDGIPVLPYYLVYRALVRATVASLRLRNAGEEQNSELHEECAGYLSLAERYAFARRPRLIVMHGLSGTGKSFRSREIVQKLGAIRIRSDVERKRIAERTDTREGYSREMTRRTYDRLQAAAARGLEAGFPVVLDATYLHEAQRSAARAMAARLTVPFRIISLRGRRETLEDRIRQRQKGATDPSDADIAVLRHQINTEDPLTEAERGSAIEVDTEQPGCWAETLRHL